MSFDDLVHRRPDGGVDIDIDHPRGQMRWELPGQRAEQLETAIRAARSPGDERDVRARVVRALADKTGIGFDDDVVEAVIAAVRGVP